MGNGSSVTSLKLSINQSNNETTKMTNSQSRKSKIEQNDPPKEELKQYLLNSQFQAQSVIITDSLSIILIEYICKMPKVYQQYQMFGQFKPRYQSYLGKTSLPAKILENGEIYEGEWKDNKKSGFGSLIQFNVGFYQGYFKDDMFYYEGRFIDKDGKLLEGQWFENKLNGIGIIKNDEFNYQGEIKDGEPNGEGFKDYRTFYYKGQFYKGMKNGKGKHTFKNGSEYEGDFFESQMHGRGCYRFENHKNYEGEFLNGEITGEGTMVWPNGQRYQGHFEKGLRHGYGILTEQDGTEYKGNWIENQQDGQFTKKNRNELIQKVSYKMGILQNQ